MAGIIADQMSPDLFAGVQGSGTSNSQTPDAQKTTAPATFNWTTGNSQGQSQAPYPTFNWTTGNSQSQAPSSSSGGSSVNNSAFVTGGAGVSPASSGQASAPSQWNVTTPQTVQGQMANLMDMNNPIIQQAMTQAKQHQLANGTLNSSMAETAGLNAAYNTILPIATADAGTNAKAGSYNADIKNQTNIANAQMATTLTNTSMNNASAQAIAGMNSETSKSIAQLNSETQTNINKLDNQNKLAMQTLGNQNQTLLSTNQQAAQLFSNTVSALNNIAMSTTMGETVKTEQSAQVWANLQSQLNVLGKTSGLNLSELLGPSPYTTPATTSGATTDPMTNPNVSPGPGYVWQPGSNGNSGLWVSNSSS